MSLTNEERKAYCRNLVHVPDNLREICVLLSLLSEKEIEQNLPIEQYHKIQNSLHEKANTSNSTQK